MKQASSIGDMTKYNARMAKSMIDKLFFVDKIDTDAIVDYGCADGTTLALLAEWMPETKLFAGYDVDANMIDLAKHKVNLPAVYTSNKTAAARFSHLTTKWDEIEFLLFNIDQGYSSPFKSKAILLSSIVHEICHYSTPEQIHAFWDIVFNSGFDYIVLRDMMPSASVDRPAFPDDVAKVYAKFYGSKELQDFERCWGSIESNKNLIHFLLKYKYVQPNWEREVRENYMPVYREEFLAKIPRHYKISYHEHYPLPWLRKQIDNDFGIELKDNTHLKIILEKK